MRGLIRVHPCHPWPLQFFRFPIWANLGHLWLLPLFLSACAHHAEPKSPPPASPALLSTTHRVEPWSFRGHRGSLITTPNYRLYSTCTDQALVSQLPGFLERALTEYTTAFGPLPKPTLHLDTFLLADRSQWEALTRQLMGAEAPTYLRIERGGFASGGRAVLLPLGPRDTFAIAAHEGWHQYTQRAFRDPLPTFLEEGLATLFEGLTPDPAEPGRFLLSPQSNPERLAQLRRADSGRRLLSLSQIGDITPDTLLTQDQDAALTWYAQCWALARFLSEDSRYAPSLHRLLADAASGAIRTTLTARSDSLYADRVLRARQGAEVLTAYFGDLRTSAADFDRFVGALLAPTP